mgnify:CR=1 FL=1
MRRPQLQVHERASRESGRGLQEGTPIRRIGKSLSVLACVGVLIACGSADPPLPPPEEGARTHAVHVVSNGWHTAIVIPRADVVAAGAMPEARDFPDSQFLEFAWGDRDYFPAREKTIGMTLSAALWPTPAVMHIVALNRDPVQVYRDVEVLVVPLSEAGLGRLIEAVDVMVDRPPDGPAEAVAPGLMPLSGFYPATGEYHLLNTSNTWTVRMIRIAGVDVSSSGVVTAEDAMARLRRAPGVSSRAARDERLR